MVTKESFKALLNKIVVEHLPDESDAFNLGADDIISQAVSQKQLDKTKDRDKFGAVDWSMVKIALDIVLVAFNGWKAILEIAKLKKEKNILASGAEPLDLNKIQLDLEKVLKKNGVKKAKVIAEDFVKEAQKLPDSEKEKS